MPGPGPEPGPHRPPIVGGGGAIGGGIIGGAIGGGAAGAAGAPSGGGNNGGAAAQNNPPYIPDEIVVSFAAGTPPQAITQFAARNNLSQIETQNFPLIGNSLYRWRIGGGRSVGSIVTALGSDNIVATVQPNYIFSLQDDAANVAQGDPGQYVLAELQVAPAQQLAIGKNILVAVIDSEIDAAHPDLGGTIVKSFDALPGAPPPHVHGTSIAGAIASHGKLLGIAPGAEILAVHAFDGAAGEATANSFAIYKGVQWAADNAHHQYELCRSVRSDAGAASRRRLRQRHRADRGGRQWRSAIGAALPRGRSRRHRRHRDRRQGACLRDGQPWPLYRGRRPRRRYSFAGSGRRLSAQFRHVDRRRPCQRHRGDAA
jgi:hypothetical protein